MSILLTDPVLNWLTPAESQKLRVLNKEHRIVIDEHTRTATSYRVPMKTTLRWNAREALYARYPNVQTLTFEDGGPDIVSGYLRPTLKSLHLVIPLQLSLHPDERYFQWENAELVGCTLESLLGFLTKTPEAQLERLTITFHNVVKLDFLDERSFVVDYDRDGPIYEEEDVMIEDPYGAAGVYFSVMEETPHKEWIIDLLKGLYEARSWKSFSLPAEFPGATEIPLATLSEPCDTDDETIESLWEHIQTLRYQQN